MHTSRGLALAEDVNIVRAGTLIGSVAAFLAIVD
jgi:hypothetical protein